MIHIMRLRPPPERELSEFSLQHREELERFGPGLTPA
jgi:hypothetical protein